MKKLLQNKNADREGERERNSINNDFYLKIHKQ